VEEAVICIGEISPTIKATAGASDWIKLRSAGLRQPDKPRKFRSFRHQPQKVCI